jgi:5'-deoxynucleotidase YfbR-like HD superfamily hydrolase
MRLPYIVKTGRAGLLGRAGPAIGIVAACHHCLDARPRRSSVDGRTFRFERCRLISSPGMPPMHSQGERRAWQRMLSGRRLDLLDPSPFDIELEDVAVGLARVARWNGQTSGSWPLSVAQHSLAVEHLVGRFRPAAPPDWRLLAVLHDAPEYVIGDLITPFKTAIGSDYGKVEARLMQAIRLRFGIARLPRAADALIKRADRAAAYLEAVALAGFPEDEARRLFDPKNRFATLEIDRDLLKPLPPPTARDRFVARVTTLLERIDGRGGAEETAARG